MLINYIKRVENQFGVHVHVSWNPLKIENKRIMEKCNNRRTESDNIFNNTSVHEWKIKILSHDIVYNAGRLNRIFICIGRDQWALFKPFSNSLIFYVNLLPLYICLFLFALCNVMTKVFSIYLGYDIKIRQNS